MEFEHQPWSVAKIKLFIIYVYGNPGQMLSKFLLAKVGQ